MSSIRHSFFKGVRIAMFSCICFKNHACNREDDVSSESQLVAGKHPIHPTTNFPPTQSDDVALSPIEPSRIGQLEVPPLHALCVHVLAESPSIIGIFSDSPDGRVVYQNEKSFEYYGDLGKAKADAPSTFPHILNSLLSYERSHEINVTSLLSELNATGLWSGSIKVPQRLHPGPQEKEDMPSPAGQMKSYEASLSPLPSPYAKAQSSPLGSGQETDLSNSHSRGQGSNTVPLDVVQVTAYSASFRKAPKKVKSLLMPGFQALLSGTNGSINSRHDGDPPLGSTSKYCRTNSLLDRPPINSSSSKLANSSSGRNLLRSKTLSGKELSPSTSFIPPVLSNIVEAALEAQIPQLVINNAASNPMARPPRVPSEAIEFESINLNSALKTWDEADPEEGLMISTFESLNKSTTSPFQWHDLTIKKIKSPVTGEPLIVMTQSDVTVRVAMEKAMLDCANTQLKMVSSIFPLHVVEFFNQQRDMKKRTAREMEADIGQLARSHKGVTILFMVGF